MIFVTVGTHTAAFDRLVRAADAYAATSGERVVIQRGASHYRPMVARSFAFCDSAEMERLISASRAVVCHAADTILDAIRLQRPVVAVPRQERFGEHLNDHQLDLATALANRGIVVALTDLAGLAEAIETAVDLGPPAAPGEPPLALAIRALMGDWFPTINRPATQPGPPAPQQRRTPPVEVQVGVSRDSGGRGDGSTDP